MNTIRLNTIGDSPIIIKKGSQVQSQEKTVEITENGTTEVVPDSGFSLSKVTINANVESSGSATKWTGHADAEGLKAIGWTDEDIAYYQANGVNWNEEDDEYHKVTDDNKALYGVLTADNISTYKDRIVYLPKISLGSLTSINSLFRDCANMIAVPSIDFSNVTSFYYVFAGCLSLVCIPPIVNAKGAMLAYTFYNCKSLKSVDIQVNATNLNSTFAGCDALEEIRYTNDTIITFMSGTFTNAWFLRNVNGIIDVSGLTLNSNIFSYSYSIEEIRIKNLSSNIGLEYLYNLTKDSLIYIIDNENSGEAVTITLHYLAYKRYGNDPDVLNVLEKHPNIALAGRQ